MLPLPAGGKCRRLQPLQKDGQLLCHACWVVVVRAVTGAGNQHELARLPPVGTGLENRCGVCLIHELVILAPQDEERKVGWEALQPRGSPWMPNVIQGVDGDPVEGLGGARVFGWEEEEEFIDVIGLEKTSLSLSLARSLSLSRARALSL